MSKLQDEFDKVTDEIKRKREEKKELEKDEKVKKYIELKKLLEELDTKQYELSRDIQKDIFDRCNHIIVRIHEVHNGTVLLFRGCVRCGLTDKIIYDRNNREYLEFEEMVMLDYLINDHKEIIGLDVGISGDLELAKAVYNEIEVKHPQSSDRDKAVSLRETLENIQNNTDVISKPKLARKLGLKPDFNNWDKVNATD